MFIFNILMFFTVLVLLFTVTEKFPRMRGQGMVLIGTLSLREARSGTNAVKYTAISTGGLQGIPMRTIPCLLIRCLIGSV